MDSPAPTPSLDELYATAEVLTFPLTTRFRGLTQRTVLLVKGPAGWAEWAPFEEYGPAEAAHWLANTIEMGWATDPHPDNEWVPVNATVPAVDPDAIPGILARYPGVGVVKLKVAEKGEAASRDRDLARIRVIREVAPDCLIRLDANGGWGRSQALDMARTLADLGLAETLDYLEQPCPTTEDLAWLRHQLAAEGIPIRIAADESIRKADDPLRALTMGAVDQAVIKAAPLGGPSRVVEVARIAAEHGAGVTISSALDSCVGLYAGLVAAARIARHLGHVSACGLATGQLFAKDVGPRREIVDGRMRVYPASEDDVAAAVENYSAPPQVRQWWLRRLSLTYDAYTSIRPGTHSVGGSSL